MARLPSFVNSAEEAEFWDRHDSTEFFDDTEEVEVEVVDKRPKTLISLRLPSETIDMLKLMAKNRGLGYQTLMRMWVMERLELELAGYTENTGYVSSIRGFAASELSNPTEHVSTAHGATIYSEMFTETILEISELVVSVGDSMRGQVPSIIDEARNAVASMLSDSRFPILAR